MVAVARKNPVQQRSRATVDAILEATTQILVEEGYDKATTNRIAKRAGVSIGSLYQYFANKEALITELCERHVTAMVELIARQVDTGHDTPIEESTRSLVRALLHAHSLRPKLHAVLIEQVPRISGFDRVVEIDRIFVEMIRQGLEGRREALQPPDLELASFVLVHSVQAVTHAAILHRPDALRDEALAEEIVQLILRYLLKQPPD